jgi:hypothetical protein
MSHPTPKKEPVMAKAQARETVNKAEQTANDEQPSDQNEDGEAATIEGLRSVHGIDRGGSDLPEFPATDESVSGNDNRVYPGDVAFYETVDIDGIARGVDEPVAKEFLKSNKK